MQLWGKTAAGTQRFYCASCRASGTRKRADNVARQRSSMFVDWITTSEHLNTITRRYSVSRKTLIQWMKPYWKYIPTPRIPKQNVSILVVDATSVVKRECVALIALDASTSTPVSWSFSSRESYTSWKLLLAHLATKGINPRIVVCDGQKGMLKAIHEVWPDATIQRCMIHIVRQTKLWLTQHPQTPAGQELLVLIRSLLDIRTPTQRDTWIRMYGETLLRHEEFLKERSWNDNHTRWWYTHRKLRAVRSLLSNSIPDVFTFIDHPHAPRTSNHVEGGINSRLKDLYRIHRGLSAWKKIVLTSWYLTTRQRRTTTKKPTRKVT